MTENDKLQFAKILAGLASLKRSEYTIEGAALFWNAMRDWSIEEFTDAANHLVKTCQYLPEPHHFDELRRASRAVADEAWLKVLDAVQTYAERTPSGKRTTWDPLIDRVAASVGGLDYIAHANNEDDLPHIRRRFIEAYNTISDVEQTREAVPQIASEAAHENRRRLASAVSGFGSVGNVARLPERKE